MPVEAYRAITKPEAKAIFKYSPDSPLAQKIDRIMFTPQEADTLWETGRFEIFTLSGKSINHVLSENPSVEVEIDPLVEAATGIMNRSGHLREVAVYPLPRYHFNSSNFTFTEQASSLDSINTRMSKALNSFGRFTLLEPREQLEIALYYKARTGENYFEDRSEVDSSLEYWEAITRGLFLDKDGERYVTTVRGSGENLFIKAQRFEAKDPLTFVPAVFEPKLVLEEN